MKLYHGTNQDITTIDPSLGMRHKDFGQGFYLTPEYDTASRMAQKRARLFGGTPTIIEYEFDVAHSINAGCFFHFRNSYSGDRKSRTRNTECGL